MNTQALVESNEASSFGMAWRKLAHPISLISLAALVLLAVFIAYPIGIVLYKGVVAPGDGAFTLRYFGEFFSKDYYYRSIRNSLVLGVVTTASLMVLGFFFAFAVTRGPTVLRMPLRIIALLPLIAPHYIFAVSFIILAGRQGLLTKGLHLEPWTIYGWDGVILSQVLSFLPIAFIMIENVLKSLDPHMEESARDQGAREFTVLRTITMPLCTPGILKAGLLVFSLSIADFANPALLGGKLSFLAPDAYSYITGEMNIQMGSVVSTVLVVPCIAIFLIHHYWLKGKSYTTVGGRPASSELRYMGAVSVIMVGVCLLVGLVVLANFAVTVFGAFTQLAGVDNTFTLRHMVNAEGWAALVTSLEVSLIVGIVGTVLGNVLAYVLMRGNVPGREILEFLALAGFALPGTVLGIGYLMAFNEPPLHLTNTFAILVIVTVFHSLAVPLELGYSKLHQISREMEEASADLGGRFGTTFRRVILPLMSSSFVAGFIYSFMYSMVSVSALVLLVAPGKMLASVYIFQMADLGSLSTACAVTVYLMAIVLLCLASLRAFLGFSTKRFGFAT
jgi:iron(III) transport system permease protein